MASTLNGLTSRNLAALGMLGFSAAFAVFLLHGLYVDRTSLAAAALNLAAACALVAVCAVSWRAVLAPHRAGLSWRLALVVAVACVLAVAARLPAFQA